MKPGHTLLTNQPATGAGSVPIREGYGRGAGTGLAVNTAPLRDDHDSTIGAYLSVVQTMHECSKLKGFAREKDGLSFGKNMQGAIAQREYSRHIWKMLKRAKVVAIPGAMYTKLYRKWDRRLTEELGYVWRPPSFTGALAPIEEARAIANHTMSRTAKVGFPERLPFDVVYIAYEGGVSLTSLQLSYKTNRALSERIVQPILLGTLISEGGVCVDFFVGIDAMSKHPNVPTVFNSFHRGPEIPGVGTGSTWLGGDGKGTFDLLPFILHDMVEHVNSFVDLSVSSFPKSGKQEWRRNRKRLGVEKKEPPPHYYPYKLKSSVTREGREGTGKPREPLSYRTDVRGHVRLYIRRGPKPMSPARWRYYSEQGFKVYIDDEPPRETREKMRVKGHVQKTRSEWMAVKEKWIEPHLNSKDESLPYRQKLTIA